jgi:hypothetical protein
VKALARAIRSSESASSPPPHWTRGPRSDEERHGRSGSRFTGWVGGDDE